MIILGEFHIDVELVTRLVPDDLIFKARNKLPGAERELIAFRLAALKRFTVHKAFKVDDNDVILLCGTVFGPLPCGRSVQAYGFSSAFTSSAVTLEGFARGF